MRRLILGVLLVGAFACRPKESSPGRPAATPVTSASASASAPASAVIAAPPVPGTTFSFVGVFAPGVTTHAFRLGRSVAVSQSSEHGWSVTTVSAARARVELTAKLGAKRRTPNIQILFVGGSAPDDAWISVLDEVGFPALAMDTWHVTGDAVARTAKRYLAMGALRPGQWVALPTHQGPVYLYDQVPSKFEGLRGKGALPTVPADVHLLDVAFLGDGRACGLGVVEKPDAGTLSAVLWLSGADNAARTLPLGAVDDAEAMRVVRGPGGECVVVTPGEGATTLARARGDALASVKMDRRATLATAVPSGTLWFYDDEKKAMGRAELAKDPIETAAFALPGGLADCTELTDVTSVVALDDDDVWLTGQCWAGGKMRGDALLHTEPPGNVDVWPAP
ncbi:MAG TPA: hypothetical protein VF316_14160 [Polyangiaceae bacterium]